MGHPKTSDLKGLVQEQGVDVKPSSTALSSFIKLILSGNIPGSSVSFSVDNPNIPPKNIFQHSRSQQSSHLIHHLQTSYINWLLAFLGYY